MNTPFEKLSKDHRESWRNQPATEAYLSTLRSLLRDVEQRCCYRAQDIAWSGTGRPDELTFARFGGEMAALAQAIEIATKGA